MVSGEEGAEGNEGGDEGGPRLKLKEDRQRA